MSIQTFRYAYESGIYTSEKWTSHGVLVQDVSLSVDSDVHFAESLLEAQAKLTWRQQLRVLSMQSDRAKNTKQTFEDWMKENTTGLEKMIKTSLGQQVKGRGAVVWNECKDAFTHRLCAGRLRMYYSAGNF